MNDNEKSEEETLLWWKMKQFEKEKNTLNIEKNVYNSFFFFIYEWISRFLDTTYAKKK